MDDWIVMQTCINKPLNPLGCVREFTTNMQIVGEVAEEMTQNVTHVALNLATIHAVQRLAKFRGAFSSCWSSRLKPDGLFKQGWSVRTSACDTESF